MEGYKEGNDKRKINGNKEGERERESRKERNEGNEKGGMKVCKQEINIERKIAL
jgi:hypothetical protein